MALAERWIADDERGSLHLCLALRPMDRRSGQTRSRHRRRSGLMGASTSVDLWVPDWWLGSAVQLHACRDGLPWGASQEFATATQDIHFAYQALPERKADDIIKHVYPTRKTTCADIRRSCCDARSGLCVWNVTR